MKNINRIINRINWFMVVGCIIFATGCKDDDWNEHYSQLDSRLESNLLALLYSEPEYSTFFGLLEQTGYDDVLKTDQAYTVWAPNNTAMEQVSDDVLNNSDLLNQFVGNHISRFSYNSSNSENPVLVKMMNNKYIEFLNDTGTVSFGGVEVIEKDILASNGILHEVTDILEVKSNIWGYLNENVDEYIILMDYLTQFNEIVFDEANSVEVGTNTLGQTVYDSIFSSSNSFFKTIGDLSSEEERFTFIGLTDAVYTDTYDNFKDYYNNPIEDSIKFNTDKIIFSNINFPLVNLEDLTGTAIQNTVGNSIALEAGDIAESLDLSNGNLFIASQLNYEPKDLVYNPIRYEIENSQRRVLGSVTDFIIQDIFDPFASESFTNAVSLLNNPEANDSNNYFEIAFSNVLSASYTINLKFSPIGASQSTKLKFELSYVDENKNTIVNEIPAIIVNNQEDGVIQIGDTYTFPVYINEEDSNDFFVKLKVIIDVTEPELLLYDRSFGIDYAELVPIE